MVEIFKDLEDYKGKYQISNLGSIREIDEQGKYHEIQPKICVLINYFKVRLYDCNNYGRMLLVHYLVAETFLEKDKNLKKNQVVHIDGNGFNNDIKNLKWIKGCEKFKVD